MNAFAIHLSSTFRAGLRNRQLLFLLYFFPLSFYFLVGFVMTEINPGFREIMIPAMIVFTTLATKMLGLPDPLVAAREAGIYRSYKINGVPAWHILVIPALTSILHLSVVIGIILISAPILFDAPLPTNWGGFALVYLVSAAAFAGLGVLIGVISSSSRGSMLWSQLVFLPSMLIGGVMIPYSMLPASMQTFARVLPTPHAMNAFLDLAFNMSVDLPPWGSLALLAASSILNFGLAGYLFNWDSHNQTRRGNPLWAVLAILPYALGVIYLV
jgi:ABC-2 type transport system permease protein